MASALVEMILYHLLSHWDPYAMHRDGCLELYYRNMVEWSWLAFKQCFFCDGTSRHGVPENLTTG